MAVPFPLSSILKKIMGIFTLISDSIYLILTQPATSPKSRTEKEGVREKGEEMGEERGKGTKIL